MLILVVALVACEPVVTDTETPPTPTDAPELAPTATDAPEEVPTVTAPAEESGGAETDEEAVEPGGVDVAMELVNIPDEEVIALVNGEEISTAAYQEELERALNAVTAQYGLDWNDAANTALLPTFQGQVLDQLIDRTLLKQLAGEEGITVDAEDIEAEIASIQEQIEADATIEDWDSFLAQNNLTEEVIRSLIADQLLTEALVESHSGSTVQEQVHASHILVETEETGQEVLDLLEEGRDFEDLAAEYSTDPGSKDQGGDLGWFPRGMMVPEFEEAAFSLEPGETSGLVESDFGFHIIRVHEKEEREVDPALAAQNQQREFQTWFEAQQAAAEIERLFTFEDEGAE
jgi:foldase protein PrsA